MLQSSRIDYSKSQVQKIDAKSEFLKSKRITLWKTIKMFTGRSMNYLNRIIIKETQIQSFSKIRQA